MAVVGEAVVRIRPDTKGFGRQVEQEVEAPMVKAAKRIGVALAGAFAVQRIGSFFKSSIDEAAAAEEAASKVSVVFGDASGSVLEFADNATDAFAQSRVQALAATGVFGNLFRAMGLTEQASAGMATSLTGLASDLASFNDVEIDEALDALRSGLVGETEPLRRLGVQLSAARIEAKALSLGLASTKDELTAGAKAQAAYALILEDTALAQGDMARTAESATNQQKFLSAEFANAKLELGDALLPLFVELVSLAREDLIPALSELGTTAVPLVGTAFEIASPFIGTTTTLLNAMLPVIDPLVSLLDKIPAPLLQLAALGVGVNASLGLVTKGLTLATSAYESIALRALYAGDAIRNVEAGAAKTATGLTNLNVAAVGVAAGIGAAVFAYQKATEASRKYDARVDELTDSLLDAVEAQDRLVEAQQRSDLQESFEALGDENLRTLRALGIGLEDIFAAIQSGGDAIDPIREKLAALSGDQELLTATGDELARASYGIAVAETDRASSLERLINATQDWDNQQSDSAKATFDLAVGLGYLTEAQARQAEEASRLSDGQVNWNKALAFAERQFIDTAEGVDEMGTSTEDAIDPTSDLAREQLGLTRQARELSGEVVGSADSLRDYTDAIIDAYEAELDLGDAQQSFTDAINDRKDAQDRLNQLRGPEGALRERIAVLQLSEAQRHLNETRQGASASASEILSAEQAIISAREEAASVADATLDAEQRLFDARMALADAEERANDFRGAEGANRRRIAELEVKEAQEELAKLRRQGGAQALAEAQALVDKAKRDVAAVSDEDEGSRRRRLADKRLIDAQSNLDRVRKEGSASALQLAQAEQRVFDAQENLRRFGREAQQAAEGQVRAVQDLAQAQEDLADAVSTQGLRQAIANQKVVDAQKALTEAYKGTAGSALDIAEAELAVLKAQEGLTEISEEVIEAQDDLRAADRDLERAALDLAGKTADLEAQTGDLGDTADGIARGALQAEIDALKLLAETMAPGSALRTRLDGLISDLEDLDGDFRPSIHLIGDAAARLKARELRYEISRPIDIPVNLQLSADQPAKLVGNGVVEVNGQRLSLADYLKKLFSGNTSGTFGGFFGSAQGFFGHLDKPSQFILGDAPEDALVVPTALGGIDAVVSDLVRRISPKDRQPSPSKPSGGGVTVADGAIRVTAGPDASPQAIAREVVDLLGYELTVRSEG